MGHLVQMLLASAPWQLRSMDTHASSPHRTHMRGSVLRCAPAGTTEGMVRPMSRSHRPLSFLHLQKLPSSNGREALRSRALLHHLISEGHTVQARAIVGNPHEFATLASEYPQDLLSPSDFRADPPDVITSEQSLFVGGVDRLRLADDDLAWYLAQGGVIIVDQSHSWDEAAGDGHQHSAALMNKIVRATTTDHLGPDHQGHRLLHINDEVGADQQEVGCIPSAPVMQSLLVDSWLAPAYSGIDRLSIWNVRPLAPLYGDILGYVTDRTDMIDTATDTPINHLPPYVWGTVEKVRQGFFVSISAYMIDDFTVGRSPDNALFIQQLAELLVGEVERDRQLTTTRASRPTTSNSAIAPVEQLIARGEGPEIEFKSSALHDLRTNAKNKDLLDEISKHVAGFWNASGGDLLVGVADDGTITGIDCDFPYVHHNNEDGWVRRIEEHLDNRLGSHVTAKVRISVDEVGDGSVGRIRVPRGDEPVFHLSKAKSGDTTEVLWLRRNNSTSELTGRDLALWIKDRH